MKDVALLQFRLLWFVLFLGATAFAGTCKTFYGLISESAPTRALILANWDSYLPIFKMHAIVKDRIKDTPVIVLVPRELSKRAALAVGSGNAPSDADVTVVQTGVAGSWVRDWGPQMVRDRQGNFSLVRFSYSHPQVGNSNEKAGLASRDLAAQFKVPLVESPLEIQWGALFVDGKNRLFVSHAVLKQNPKLSETRIERELKRVLHVDEVQWLPPLPREGTGHLDIYAKYMGGDTILLAKTTDPQRRTFLAQMADQFRKLGFKVVRVQNAERPQQSAAFTYTNSVVVNGQVFIPQYAEREDDGKEYAKVKQLDDEAVAVYRSLGFKRKDIIQVPSRALIRFGGTVHCLTCQISMPTNP